MSLKELPITHFKVAVEELNHRYKVCLSLSGLIEEVVEQGSTTGKLLSKVGSQTFLPGQSPWLPTCSIALESIFKMTTSTSGKQLVGFSSNLGQNISKQFPEHVRAGKRRVLAISTKISGLVDEYKKARTQHLKNLEKYQRSVADAEAAIRSRHAASEGDGRAASVDRDTASAQSMGGADNFMNRSLNKMLSKIAPEKKLEERCRDMVREVDTSERALINSGKRLLVQRSDLIIEITKAMAELEELETQRLNAMREGLSRFCIAAELIANQHSESIGAVLERTKKLDANAEAIQLMAEIDKPLGNASPGAKRRTESGSSDSDDEVDTGSELIALFAKAEKLGEAMEFFRTLVTRSSNSLLEVSEAEEAFSRAAHKLLEKHGYMRNAQAQWVYAADYSNIPMLAEPPPAKSAPLSAAIGAVGATTLALTGGLRSGEFLSRFESPLTKAGWELVVGSLGNGADLQMRSSEVASEEVCQQLELVTQRLEIGRRELVEKLASNSKMVDNAKAEVKRLSTKLAKCKALLKERRETVKQVKEVIQSDAMENNSEAFAAAVAATADAAARESVGSPENPSALGATLDDAPVTASAAPEQPSSIPRKTSLFRKGGLKQVVGLETLADRVSRIEKQVASLEEEERELIASLAAAEQALVKVTTVAKTQVLPIFDATREFLSTDLVTIKNAIECLMSWKSDALESVRTFNRHTKKAHDEIEIAKDVQAYVRAVQAAAESIPKDQVAPAPLLSAGNAAAVVSALSTGGPLTLLEVPETEPFVPTTSELIIQERAVIAAQQPAPSLYTISNLAMAAYSSGNTEAGEGSPTPGALRARRNTEDGTAAGQSATQSDATSTEEDGASMRSLSAPFESPAPATQPPLSATPSADSTTLELAKFGLTANDKVIESYSCALYPKKGLLTHGRMFITQHYAAFSGWPDTRVLLLLRNIEEVNRVNTLFYVPNALSIVMKDKSEYFFGSFIDREQCYANLISLSDVGKHMATLPGYNESAELRNLEFGYQTCNNFFGGGDDSEVSAVNSGATTPSEEVGMLAGETIGTPMRKSPSPAPGAVPRNRSATPTKATAQAQASSATPETKSPSRPSKPQGPAGAPSPVKMKETAPPAHSTPSAPQRSSSPAPTPAQTAATTSTASSTAAPAAGTAPTSTPAPTAKPAPGSAAAPVRRPSDAESVDVDDGINLSTLFERSNISLMQEKVFSFPTTKLWSTCWLHAKGYGAFLLEEGELDINYSEWQPLKNPTVPEDVAKLPYCCSRQFSYSHPRTTMLMFGPKNAPTMQTQYLYIPGGRKLDPMNAAAIAGMRPARGVIMTLTSFQGIPMCDVFKVLQYWSFERNAADHSRTEMRVGLAIHYMKTSMFKAQIYGGSKEELTVQSLKWINYAEKCCHAPPAEMAAAFVEEVVEHAVEEDGTRPAAQVRRSSLRRLSGIAGLQQAAEEAASVLDSTDGAAAAAGTGPVAMNLAEDRAPSTVAGAKQDAATGAAAGATSAMATAKALPAVQVHVDTNQLVIALACTVVVLLILLYRESAHNSALVQQVNVLSRKIELTQTSMEVSLRQSQAVMAKMEELMRNIQR